MVCKYEYEIAELREMVFYEPIAHDQFMDNLKRCGHDPLLLSDLNSMRTENDANKTFFGLGEYYRSILHLTPIEK